MNKRLRKKLHKGEFKELGFGIFLKLRPELTETELEAWLDDLIEIVERLNLGIGGGGRHEQEFFCSRLAGRSPVSLEDQEALGRWLAQDGRLVSFKLGNLEDAWYPAKSR
jgi:uncharacterized protein YggL (DUF469 family)